MARYSTTAMSGRVRRHRSYATNHGHHARAAFVRLALLASLLPLLAMCTGAPESRRVADQFMELYYSKSRVADAVKLCTGTAKAKLEGEIAGMQGMAPPSDEPRVTYRLTSEGATGVTQATYVYDVDPRTSDVSPLTTTLVLSGEGGQWLVTAITEKTRGS